MGEIIDGGPAFPRPPVPVRGGELKIFDGDSGMSLRDWFAGQALSVLLGARGSLLFNGVPLDGENQVAEMAYVIADAMLAVRAGAPLAGTALRAAYDVIKAIREKKPLDGLDDEAWPLVCAALGRPTK